MITSVRTVAKGMKMYQPLTGFTNLYSGQIK